MNQRINISLILVLLSLVLISFPGVGKYTFLIEKSELSLSVFDESRYFSPDQLARFVVDEDSSVQLIDLRHSDDYKAFSIPGAINIPFELFYSSKPESYLHNPDLKYIFYSNGDINSNSAMVMALGLGYKNCYVMQGGLNRWFEDIMLSSFRGESISARENRIYESRRKARLLFTEINSLPDSLKLKYLESRRQSERELDGGCE